VQQMTHLVDDLMEVSRITQGRLQLRKQSANLADIIQNALETTHALMKAAGHELTISLPDEAIILYADVTRLIQVISNLLTNASKYTPNGGKIWLKVERLTDTVKISIRDSGIGIAREHLANVFEMFSQLTPALERSQGGLGIGLALVRGLIELHGGTIQAASQGMGKGSEFTVYLPMPNITSEIQIKTSPVLTPVTSERRVLIVDDNLDAAASLAMALDMLGYVTCTANNGLSGFKKAEEFLPEVVLLDIGLPDISGYEVARQLRNASWGKDMFLIAATGWGQDKDKALAKAMGFDRHLTKPIDFSELDKIIQL